MIIFSMLLYFMAKKTNHFIKTHKNSYDYNVSLAKFSSAIYNNNKSFFPFLGGYHDED